VTEHAAALATDETVLRIALATALGLFLGLEREWSHKSAGVRTFALISLVAAVFTVLGHGGLLVVGGVLVVAQGLVLALDGLRSGAGLSLTTGVSMLVAYGVGVLVGSGLFVAGVAVAVLSSLLLVLKRQLHGFAGAITQEELQSAGEFAILAFVVFPLLPAQPMDVTFGSLDFQVELRIVWLMVVTVAAIGIVNYAIVRSYGGRGIAITGFFGGLASSTAVVGTMLDYVRQRPDATGYAVAGILLADAAMALRNLVITLGFTAGPRSGFLLEAIVPLGAVVAGSLLVAFVSADWSQPVEMDLDSPFSLRNALVFGGLFLLIVVAGGVAQARAGAAGLYAASALTGLVSSAGATTSAVVLFRGGAIGPGTASLAILIATAASIVVKAALCVPSGNRDLTTRVAVWSGAVLAVAGVGTALIAV